MKRVKATTRHPNQLVPQFYELVKMKKAYQRHTKKENPRIPNNNSGLLPCGNAKTNKGFFFSKPPFVNVNQRAFLMNLAVKTKNVEILNYRNIALKTQRAL